MLSLGAQYVGAEHDDALYVLAGQALAEGHYRMWFLPGHPPFTNGTPGLPALLAPIFWLDPGNLFLCQLMMGAIACLTAVLTWRVMGQFFSPLVSLCATALVAGNGVFLSRSGAVMPEIPYVAILMFLWLRHSKLSGPALGLALMGSYLLRPAAVALWAGVWLLLALQRKWNKLLWSVVVPLAGFSVWALWSKAGGGVQENQELSVFYCAPNVLGNAFNIVRHNAGAIATITGQSLLPLPLVRTMLAPWLGGILWTGAALGTWTAVRKTQGAEKNFSSPLLFFVTVGAAHLAMHLLWPYWYPRYYVTLLPFLILGLTQLFTHATKHSAPALATLFALGFFGQSVLWFRPTQTPRPGALAQNWIKENVPPESLCSSLYYGTDVLYTGRIFVPLPINQNAEDFHKEIKERRISFVLWKKDEENLGFSLSHVKEDQSLTDINRWLQDPTYFTIAHDDPSGTIFHPT